MTPDERAEKIIRLTHNCAVSDEAELRMLVAAEIKEAVREALFEQQSRFDKVFLNHSCDKAEAYEEGQRAGLEHAARIAKINSDIAKGFSGQGCDCSDDILARAKELK